jgi:hypothetical protein
MQNFSNAINSWARETASSIPDIPDAMQTWTIQGRRPGIRLQHNWNSQGMIPTWLLPKATLENYRNTKLHISTRM